MKLEIKNKSISYRKYLSKLSQDSPFFVFLSGFSSDKNSTKASFVYDYCREKDLNFVSFDYTGHGESSGNIMNGSISSWLDDTLDVIDNLTNNKVILIGSSMGGWLAILAALTKKEIVKGVITIAAAADFTERIWQDLSISQRETLMSTGKIEIYVGKNNYQYTFSKDLILDGKKHHLLHNNIDIHCPVILIHGYKDTSVPITVSLKIAELLNSEKVQLLLSKNSGHRMSQDSDLKMLKFALDSFTDCQKISN